MDERSEEAEMPKLTLMEEILLLGGPSSFLLTHGSREAGTETR